MAGLFPFLEDRWHGSSGKTSYPLSQHGTENRSKMNEPRLDMEDWMLKTGNSRWRRLILLPWQGDDG